MSKALLTFTDVTVHRAGVDALQNINWQVGARENWAVIGPNGSGKSSLAAAIAGQAATTGEIDYGFDDRGGDPCERVATVSFQLQREYIAQSDGYYASRWYLGEEQATLTPAQVLGVDKNRGRKDVAARVALAGKMGLAHALDRQALHLSTGEMRRLLVTRALILAPEILVLDEPLIGLGHQGSREPRQSAVRDHAARPAGFIFDRAAVGTAWRNYALLVFARRRNPRPGIARIGRGR